jgi:starvation-inducible DNA-binding protein
MSRASGHPALAWHGDERDPAGDDLMIGGPTMTQTTTSEAGSTPAELARLLADTYTLYLKTHGYHWNVTGPRFPSLHMLFETQYLEMREAVDEIAERIRALGEMAPGSYRQLGRLTGIAEDEGVPEASEMVSLLADDHETVAATARAVLDAAEADGDAATVDLATRRITIHDKTRWMLRATAEVSDS